MGRFIVRRLIQFPLILAVIYLVTFFLAWVAPGSPFERSDRRLDPKSLEIRKQQLHAQHWYTFLGHYPLMVLRGDFGPSLVNDVFSVNKKLSDTVPVSVTLGMIAMMVATVAGVSIGTLAAVKRGGVFDWLSLGIAMIGISLPSFVVAAVLLMLFCVVFSLVPLDAWSFAPHQLVLPALALSLMPMAYIARLTRVSMIDVLSADFIRTARAKGLSRSRILWKHALKNAFLPVLSYLGPAAAATLTGSFVVERIFSIPGLGDEFVSSIQNRDQTMILGTVLVYSFFLLTLNLLVDVGYAVVDPRIEG